MARTQGKPERLYLIGLRRSRMSESSGMWPDLSANHIEEGKGEEPYDHEESRKLKLILKLLNNDKGHEDKICDHFK